MIQVNEFTDEYIKQQKDVFLNSFFKFKSRNYHEDDKHVNKLVDIHFEPVENIPRTLIFTLFNQYKHSFNKDWNEYISVVISLVVEATSDYEPKAKGFDWSILNVRESKSNLHLKSHITNRLQQRLVDESRRQQNQTYGQMTVIEGGKKVKYRTIIDTDQQSHSADINDGEGNRTALTYTMSDKSTYGYQNSLYHPTQFLKYFRENKDDILTNGQKEFIKDMPKFLHEEGSQYTESYADDPNQKFNVNQQGGFRRQIKLRTLKAYEKEHSDSHEITLLQMKKESDSQLLNEFIHTVYDSFAGDLGGLNTYISNWIYERLNDVSNSLVSDLLHDRLATDELKHMNLSLHNGYRIGNKLIYKIVELLEGEIQRLESFDTSVAGRARGNSGRDKEFHEGYRNYLHRINNKDIKVYDIKTGKLIGTEQVKQEGRNYKVLRLNTYGIRTEVGELDVGIN